MAKKRANGEGNIRKRKDGRWEGRYTAGTDPGTGKAIIKNVLGKTQAEDSGKHCRLLQNVHRHPHPPQAGRYQAEPASDHGYPKAIQRASGERQNPQGRIGASAVVGCGYE